MPEFFGSIPPMVTPFKEGNVDYDSFENIVERAISAGSHGILVNGTTAEPTSLSIEERNQLVTIAVRVANGRVPVIAATGSQSLKDTLTLSEAATLAGADALLVVTPYFSRPPQRGLVEYYATVGASSPLPLMLYHIPGRAAVDVSIDTLLRIRDATPNFIGMKHASTDLSFVSTVLARWPEFKIFVGLESLSLPMMAIGAVGLMNAVGNLFPDRVAALANAVLEGNLELARHIHDALFEANEAVFWDINPIPVKYMMMRMGLIAAAEHRLPMVPAEPALAARLDVLLQCLGLDLSSDSNR